jgi:hypothetical protein
MAKLQVATRQTETATETIAMIASKAIEICTNAASSGTNRRFARGVSLDVAARGSN